MHCFVWCTRRLITYGQNYIKFYELQRPATKELEAQVRFLLKHCLYAQLCLYINSCNGVSGRVPSLLLHAFSHAYTCHLPVASLAPPHIL